MTRFEFLDLMYYKYDKSKFISAQKAAGVPGILYCLSLMFWLFMIDEALGLVLGLILIIIDQVYAWLYYMKDDYFLEIQANAEYLESIEHGSLKVWGFFWSGVVTLILTIIFIAYLSDPDKFMQILHMT